MLRELRAQGAAAATCCRAVLLCAVLLIRCFSQIFAENPGWMVFHNSLEDCARQTLNTYGPPRHQAFWVVEAIERMYAAGFNMPEGRLDYAFSALVWNSEIPAEYAEILTGGAKVLLPRSERRGRSLRIAYRGMLLASKCDTKYHSKQLGTGPLGWPCPPGAAVLVEVEVKGPNGPEDRNCVIYYFPLRPSNTFQPEDALDTFKHAKDTATDRENQPRIYDAQHTEKIQLSKIAEDFYNALPHGSEDRGALSFKAVVCAPVFESEVELPRGWVQNIPTASVGVWAEYGRLAVDYVDVAPLLDLNNPPKPGQERLRLMFVYLVPTGAVDG